MCSMILGSCFFLPYPVVHCLNHKIILVDYSKAIYNRDAYGDCQWGWVE